jgi:diguanylate cyclase (GGDEF)-like protein/PAS domain S-box-containing protein
MPTTQALFSLLARATHTFTTSHRLRTATGDYLRLDVSGVPQWVADSGLRRLRATVTAWGHDDPTPSPDAERTLVPTGPTSLPERASAHVGSGTLEPAADPLLARTGAPDLAALAIDTLSDALASQPDQPALLSLSLRLVASVTGSGDVGVALRDDPTGPLRVAAGIGRFTPPPGTTAPPFDSEHDQPVTTVPLRVGPSDLGLLAFAPTPASPAASSPPTAVDRLAKLIAVGIEYTQLRHSLAQETAQRTQLEARLGQPDRGWLSDLADTGEIAWQWDPGNSTLVFSEAWRASLGYTGEEVGAGFDFYIRLVHPDDLPGTLQALYRHLARQTPTFEASHRLRHHDGSYRWVRSVGRARWDAAGRAIRVLVTQTDETAERSARDKLARIQRLFSAVSRLHRAPDVARDQSTLASQACTAIVDSGLFPRVWVGMLDETAQAIVPIATAGTDRTEIGPVRVPTTGEALANGPTGAAVLSNAPSVVNDIVRSAASAGWARQAERIGYRAIAALPIVVSDRPIGALTICSHETSAFGDEEMAMLTDIAAGLGAAIQASHDEATRRRTEDELRYLSYHDPLTGLHNRAYFAEEMRRLEGSRLYPITIIITDINGLKVINDSMGHRRGDEFLTDYARLLRSAFRTSDVVARLGGDEFAVILPNTDEPTAASLVRRLSARIEAHNARGESLPISHALGAATRVVAGEPLESLFKQADQAMYADKRRLETGSGSLVVRAMVAALATKDFGAQGHVGRVQVIAATLGEALGLAAHDLSDLDLLSEIHDLGKVGVPDSILFKPGPLDADEHAQLRQHSAIGYRIAKVSSELAHVAELILYHQEWWNGGGYPTGIRGDEIPIACRVFAVADAYDAMTSPRPHRPAMAHEDAIDEIRSNAGSQFDPAVVDRFLQIAASF